MSGRVYRIFGGAAVAAVLTLILALGAVAQLPAGANVAPPRGEAFAGRTELLVPWREGGCGNASMHTVDEPGCHPLRGQYATRTMATLYTENLVVWHTFDLIYGHEYYFRKITDLVPFATRGFQGYSPDASLVLRVTGESEHWYRVVANEDTGLVEYALKDSSDWYKTSYEYWLIWASFEPLGDINDTTGFPPLRDAPDGNVIPGLESAHILVQTIIKLDKLGGEWAYVESQPVNGKNYYGWLRWRDGRKFLGYCYFYSEYDHTPWLVN